MKIDPNVIVDAVRSTFISPTNDLVTSMIVAASLLILVLMLVMGLLLAGTPKRRKIVKVRRYRAQTAEEADKSAADAANASAEAAAKADATALKGPAETQSAEDEQAPAEEAEPAPPSRFAVASRRLAVLLTSAVVVPLLVAAALVAGYVITATDSVCAGTCHAREAGVQEATKVDHARCVACHETPGLSGVVPNSVARGRMVIAQFQGRQTARVVVVDSQACARCHARALELTIESPRGIKMSHVELNDAGVTCVSCHGQTGHNKRRDYSMSSCIGCHGGGKASTACSTCHIDDPYDATKRVASSDDSTATLGSGRITYPVVSVGQLGCGGCHNEPRDCDSCHGIRMPHSEEFVTRGHAKAAAFEKKQLCFQKCHTPDSCASGCHMNFAGAHPGNWKQEHKRAPRDAGCVCHQARSGRTEPMCTLCHNF